MTEPDDSELIRTDRQNRRRMFWVHLAFWCSITLALTFLISAIGAILSHDKSSEFGMNPWILAVCCLALAVFTAWVAIFVTRHIHRGGPTEAIFKRVMTRHIDELQKRHRGRTISLAFTLLGLMLISVLNALFHFGQKPTVAELLIDTGLVLWATICAFEASLGRMHRGDLLRLADDDLAKSQRSHALQQTYPALVVAFGVTYVACAFRPTLAPILLPIALAFSALAPAAMFAFHQGRAEGGD